MSKVGVCRITFVFIIILFTLTVIGYSNYRIIDHKDSDYPIDIERLTSYAIPGCLVVLYMLLLSSYLLCIIIKPEKVPKQYNLTTAEIAQFMIQPNSQGSFQALATLTRDYVKARPEIQVRERDYRHGGLRICEICSIIKPDRSHHCGICKQCVMRMDHHCHWVNNCIHQRNHKYFIQCIFVAVLICLITLLHYVLTIIYTDCKVIPSGTDDIFPVCLSIYIASGLSSLIGLFVIFLTLDHCTNLFKGQTSYERVYERDHYDRGWKKNFMDIMGQGMCEWLCPVAATKLSPEQEPLIVTVAEQSSAAWLATTDNRRITQYETDDSQLNRHSTSSQEEESRTDGLDQFADETLSLQQAQIAQLDPSLVTRIRTPSTLGEGKYP